MKLTRTAIAAGALIAASCRPPQPVDAGVPPLRIVEPAPGKVLSETYPSLSAPGDSLKAAVFDAINRDRAAAGLSAVAWDEAAARVADAFCAAQVAEKTRGHFLRNGIPPYARTGLAGVFGYQAENSASWISTGTSFPQTATQMALAAHRSMLAEKPPGDGHRRAILDPDATYAGVGWALAGGRFQMAQEFLVRRLQRLSVRAGAGASVIRVDGAALSPMRLRFVTIAGEPLPVPLTRSQASGRTTYRYPTPTQAFVPEGQKLLRVVGAVTQDRIHLGRDRDFSFTFAPDGPGLWTFVFWVSRGEELARPGGSAVIRAES